MHDGISVVVFLLLSYVITHTDLCRNGHCEIIGVSNIPRNADFFCLCSAHAPSNAIATQIRPGLH